MAIKSEAKLTTFEAISMIVGNSIGTEFVLAQNAAARSEERRVGKECRSRWSPYH